MLLRLAAAAMLAAPLGLADAALAREPAKAPVPSSAASSGKAAPVPAPALADKDPAATPAKQRQQACAAEWRGFSASEKTAQGPKWPQFYTRCVKRLKAQKS